LSGNDSNTKPSETIPVYLYSEPELVKFSVSSQIFRYSFITPLIENEIDHETVNSNIVTSSEPSESRHADYGFIVVPTESSSSKSSEFLSMI